ncbi:MAG: GIY-YIG nuclease family protein [Selenomonadaceae bacterium]|nr:GIY-YIG nuclease family protein [Selenomonadaceae bacterium]
MAKSVLINLFLLDGTANGRIKCTINSRTGIIFRIPRKDLSKSKGLGSLENDGVYFLLGEEDGRQKIYVGQAGSRKNGKGILNRLNEHERNPDKNFFTEAIILTTSDNSFGATELSWLEHKFCNMAIKAARCEVMNGNEPSPGNITEEKESELENHIEFAQLILSAIGYKIFEPPQKISPPPVVQDNEEFFYLSRQIAEIGKTINAKMKRTATGYKVLAGSEISSLEMPELSAPIKKLRHSAKVANGILQEDVECKSPSAAALFVTGKSSINGRTYWKTRNGVPLKNFLTE